ncbi:adenylate/guanylate cyclase domain-containing protein [Alteromonas gracilis]|uniref:adenylate/guanylate cyclase domain-containing protein n=1 Tax=Alteromonas gracilis TaxID=1479524 RepID=UPI00373684BD
MDLHNSHEKSNRALEKSHLSALSLDSPLLTLQRNNKGILSKQYIENAVVIFTDLTGFQNLSEQYGDTMCISIIEALFSQFDAIATRLDLMPLKTNGDQYIVVSLCDGSHLENGTISRSVSKAVNFSINARNLVSTNTLLVSSQCYLRVGIATGPVLAGFSSRLCSSFDIWGSTVNRAAMLEQFTAPNTIAICKNSFQHVRYERLRTNECTVENAETSGSPLNNMHCQTFHSTEIKTKAKFIKAYIC